MFARRRLLIGLLALAMVVGTTPAAMARPPGPAAEAIAFGDSSLEIADGHEKVTIDLPAFRPRKGNGGAVYDGESFRLRVQRHGGWTTTLIDIAGPDSPTEYEFGIRLPRGWSMRTQDDGSVAIENGRGFRRGTIAPPWAHDAAGNDLPTAYRIDGERLVQTVAHHGAVYPVVADPSITLGRNVYLWTRGYEIGWWGTSSAAFLSSYLCAAYGTLHPVMCAVGAVGALWLIKAFDQVFAGDRCRYVIAVRYWGWPNYMERLARYGCSYRKSDIPG